ncbi:MAG: hypothetical protein A2172_04285 [Candidatus Woykebacteria bacterium RBG_13_40_15]|uniref:Prepilin-type N-terminal cleavage/methylation domain-containing protein n=1 Tax=Candidatus Woykebacteria bacterium RBG_13_40_15 TaxID=1802593 RepID=A0A1G1W6X6_9BACT|nr:MAG: hypothetical protein A2172_04285 [Candidatus Woykebacteria bacterium RBG_13_40_15]
MFRSIKIGQKSNSRGFTLIELLVVTVVVGILGAISSVIVLSVLRSQNKTAITNEVTQNGDNIINVFERDVKFSSSADDKSTDSVTLMGKKNIVWSCGGTNITRDLGDGSGPKSVTSISVAVKSGTCRFNISGSNSDLVEFNFTLTQSSSAPSKSEFSIEVPFGTKVGLRSYGK